MTKMKLQLVVVLALVFGAQAAHAGPMHFSVFGDGAYSKETVAVTGIPSVSSNTKLGFGGGAQVEFGLGPMAGLEVGAVYLGRKTDISPLNPAFGELTYHYLQVPVQVRIWLNHFITVGVGGYYAMALGDITDANGNTATYSTAGLKKSDLGLIGSLGFNVPLAPTTSLMAEGRYAMGLQDINDPAVAGASTKWTDIQMLVGLRFGMGK
jgi:hypothetical protein